MLVVAEREQLPVPQARAGSPEAWEILFRRYQLPLYVYVFELVHDAQNSLDIALGSHAPARRVRHWPSGRVVGIWPGETCSLVGFVAQSAPDFGGTSHFRDVDRDYILEPDQAMEYGLIDHIIASRALQPVLKT